MSKQAILLVATVLVFCGGCNDFGYVGREPTPGDRAEIEAAVRACGLPVYDAKWVRMPDSQWEFGFATDKAIMERRPNTATSCVSSISEEAASRELNVSIGYYGR